MEYFLLVPSYFICCVLYYPWYYCYQYTRSCSYSENRICQRTDSRRWTLPIHERIKRIYTLKLKLTAIPHHNLLTTALKWSDYSYRNYTTDTLNLLLLNGTHIFNTTENTIVNIPEENDLKWGEFDYYRDLYITNILNTTHLLNYPNSSNGQYIVTEAARGPKNYLRIGSYWYSYVRKLLRFWSFLWLGMTEASGIRWKPSEGNLDFFTSSSIPMLSSRVIWRPDWTKFTLIGERIRDVLT